MRYLIVLVAAAALIGGAVAVLTQSSQQSDGEADTTQPREIATEEPIAPSVPAAIDPAERVVAAPAVDAVDDAARQSGPGTAPVTATETESAPARTEVAEAARAAPVTATETESAPARTEVAEAARAAPTRAPAEAAPQRRAAPSEVQRAGAARGPVPRREATEAQEPAIAILSSRHPERAARVLQGPLGPVLRADGGAGVGLDIVDYDERGDVVFAGRAEPNALVRLYSDNELVGTATADSAGEWQLTADRPIAVGDHDLRVDAVTDGGAVVGRVAMPFTRAGASSIALRDDRVIVQPGNSLWRIARATYGEGIRYTIIYEANRERIRDPNLIYPGQIFAIPTTN